jgi:hypothetical protein
MQVKSSRVANFYLILWNYFYKLIREKMSKSKNLTAKEFAETHNVSRATVTSWCRSGKLDGAFQEQTPFGAVWYIPEKTSKSFVKPTMGRPKKQKETDKNN